MRLGANRSAPWTLVDILQMIDRKNSLELNVAMGTIITWAAKKIVFLILGMEIIQYLLVDLESALSVDFRDRVTST